VLLRLWFCHAKKILVNVGYEPALGEIIMIANNTGFSTGPHTHMGLYRLTDRKQKLDTNEATGSFDPSLSTAATPLTKRASARSSNPDCATSST
jgi:murein DD-endopeptidase MepM/ murein hydrolase activator NlpD